MEEAYTSWTCGSSGELCEGGCVGSAQIPRDLLTVSSSSAQPLLSTRRSHLVALYFINTNTEAVESVNVTAENIAITMPIEGTEMNLTLYSMEVR